jgi:hypothetical protein
MAKPFSLRLSLRLCVSAAAFKIEFPKPHLKMCQPHFQIIRIELNFRFSPQMPPPCLESAQPRQPRRYMFNIQQTPRPSLNPKSLNRLQKFPPNIISSQKLPRRDPHPFFQKEIIPLPLSILNFPLSRSPNRPRVGLRQAWCGI